MAEEKMFTQEEVNKLVGQARLEGKDSGRKEYEGWISPDDLAKQKEKFNSQVEGLNEQIKTLTDEQAALKTQLTEKDGTIAEYEINSVKLRVAKDLGLSYDAIQFLKGEDEDSIRESGESLKSLVGTQKMPPEFNSERPPEEDGVTAAFRKMNPKIKI